MLRTHSQISSNRRVNAIKGLLSMSVVGLLSACGGGNELPAEAPAVAPSEASTGRARVLAIQGPERARWSAPAPLSLVPAAAANLPNGKVLLWSARDQFSFGGDGGRTYTTILDPTTGLASETLVSNTGHDMFCPGTSNLADGRLLVSGGSSAAKTSLYNSETNAWTAGAPVNIPRAYHANTVLADGSVLTLGGSWNGGVGGKHGERWTEAAGWQRLAGVPVDSMLSNDPSRNFGGDSHFWLLPTGNGKVLYAGPGVQMQWIDTRGNGAVESAGRRGDDAFSINGGTVMFDTGKILKVGGGPSYSESAATASSFVIDVRGSRATARRIVSMTYRRAFANAVVLPNGQVVVVGGSTRTEGFTDANAVLVPELFDPQTESFTAMPPMAVPRTYHGVALLLPDARVLVSGSGLCGIGCVANHADYQILSPHYLFNSNGSAATRPVLNTAPRSAAHGSKITVTSDSAIAAFSMVRNSSTTHNVNNDQRRLSLSSREVGPNVYEVDIPSNAGWAVPGEWMLFGSNAAGVPSVSKPILINSNGTPRLAMVGDQEYERLAPVSLQLSATGATSYEASGLPDGLSIDTRTGRIYGSPTRAGGYQSTVTARNGTGAQSWEFDWTITDPAGSRYVRFTLLSDYPGQPYGSAAELNLLDGRGNVIPRTGWTIRASSEETSSENARAALAIDGDPATIWHSQYSSGIVPQPHQLTIDMGTSRRVSGLRYLPRQIGINGSAASWQVHVSSDGINWGKPVGSGDMRTLGAVNAEKTVYFDNVARGRPASQSSTYPNAPASLAVDGNVDGNFAAASTTHTNSDAQAWWEVDLGTVRPVVAVRLWNRTDCCAVRLSNFHVFVSSTPMTGRSLSALLNDPSVRQQSVPGTAGRVTTLPLQATGRYVRVQLATTQFLQLAEVEVFAGSAVNSDPLLLATPAQTSSIGVAANLALQASDPDGDTLTWQAIGLPPGVNLNAATGAISGTPTTSGGYNVLVTVSDSRGGSASAAFAWTVFSPQPVLAPVQAPAMVTGANTTYTANATGAGLQYSWDFGDGSSATSFSSNPQITKTYAAAGLYSVTLTVRSSSGDIATTRFYQAVQPGAASAQARASSSVALEQRSGASSRLWTVNTDNNSVSVFDLGTNMRVAEIPVGPRPRSVAVAASGWIWVSNGGDATITIINPSTLATANRIPLPMASQPWGLVAAADGAVYVALEATGRVLKLDGSGNVQAQVAVTGARHLALSADGTRLLVSRFITAPQPGESTATVQTSLDGVPTGGELVELNPATMAQARRFTLRFSTAPDTTISARGVPNYLGAAAIAPDGRSAWVPSKQDNIQRGTLRSGNEQNLDFQSTVRAVSSRLDLSAQTEDSAARLDHDNAGFASAALYHPGGVYLFVALETNRQVAVVDAIGKRELFRIEVGRAPQGLALSADGRQLYVHNFMDRSVSVIALANLLDMGQPQLDASSVLSTVATDRLSAQVLRGKQLFYDARDTRLARDSYISCASCHSDGGHDGRTWDLTGFGEGLRNTIDLRGHAGAQGRLHWSGNFDEVQDFEGQIRALAGGTGLMPDNDLFTGTRNQPLRDKKEGVSADLDALAAYVKSLDQSSTSPYRDASGALTAPAIAGKAVFAARCASCHGGADFSSSASDVLHNIGTLTAASGQRLGKPLGGIDAPTLRDVWSTAPYLHDGSALTLTDAIRAHTGLSLTPDDMANVVSYVQQIDRNEVRGPDSQANLVVRALATLADTVGAWFEVRVNNQVVGSGQLDTRTWTDLFFDVATLVKDSLVDIVFKNDATVNGEDRNMAVQSVTINGTSTVSATASGAVIDVGRGAAATDGVDTRDAAQTGGWMPWDAALRLKAPQTSGGDTVTVRGRATLAGGVGAQMELRINGVLVGARLVSSTGVEDMVFNTPTVLAGDRIDVVFTNDAVISGEDRNLYVESITVRGQVLPASSAIIDPGSGSQAFDGVGTLAASTTGGWIPWNGALRLLAR